MSSGLPRTLFASYKDVLPYYQDKLARTEYQPFVWPYRALGPYLLICYLLLPPTKSAVVFYLRYPLFALIFYLSIEAIIECRSPMVTAGYMVGILHSWAILWSATLLVFRDARGEFRRIEGRYRRKAEHVNGHVSGKPNGSLKASGMDKPNGIGKLHIRHTDSTTPRKLDANAPANSSGDAKYYVWQPLPKTFVHRLDWVFDLVSSFRGPRWSYQISGLPPPPSHIQASLQDSSLKPPNASSNLTRADLVRQNLPLCVICYFVLDALKTTAMQDPYFWSLGSDVPSPLPWPRFTRTLLAATWTCFTLQAIFISAPIVCGVLLGPERIGEYGWPWLYHPFFGSLRNVSNLGLAGTWARSWHQLFRFGFEQAGEFVAKPLGPKWRRTSAKGALLRAGVAFTCSGLLHACASHASTTGIAKPSHAFAFFALQPVGFYAQKAMGDWMRKGGWLANIPNWILEIGNVAFVVFWFYIVGPTIADDFAASGVWLYEPVPFSLFRGLRGEGWSFWGGRWARWHTDRIWWKSGIAF